MAGSKKGRKKEPPKVIFEASTQGLDELERNVVESQEQALPEQKDTFKHESSKHKRGAHNLPDFKLPPLGYSPTKKYFALYPELHLPALHPAGDLGTVSFGADHLPPNELYLGDNLQVLRSLPSKSIDLIYIDPPFFSGRNYNLIWGDDNELRTFGDIWEDGLPSYLEWMDARLWEMARVLKDTGSIYVHCDWHASHYIKTEMDKIFGYSSFRTEIIWSYRKWGNGNRGFLRNNDSIFYYVKSSGFTFNTQHVGLSARTLHDYKGIKLKDFVTEDGTVVKRQTEEASAGAPMPAVWQIGYIHGAAKEKIGYPTQKPEELLERIIKASSNPGDVVADFFMGGGTTAAVAQKLGRRFIGADVSNVAFDVTKGRLVRNAEEFTGEKHNPGVSERAVQGKILKTEAPSILLKYVGIYPLPLFSTLDQESFKKHILTIVRARPSGTQDGISGYASGAGNQPILVGNVDVENPLDSETLRQFAQDVAKKYTPTTKITARVFAWNFPAAIKQYAKEIQRIFDMSGRAEPIVLELIPIDSEQFRQHVLQLYADVGDTSLLLSFVRSPVIGSIEAAAVKGKTWSFEAKGARAWNERDRLVNCQWDFDYQEGHFNAEKGAVLQREEYQRAKGEKSWRAILSIEHTFEKSGRYTVACKVQDSVGGETIETVEVEVK